MNKNQLRTVERIKTYLNKQLSSSVPMEIVLFEVTEDARMETYTGRKRSWVKIKAIINVKDEVRRNDYLRDTYYFLIGSQGGVVYAKKYYYGGSELDLKDLFKRY